MHLCVTTLRFICAAWFAHFLPPQHSSVRRQGPLNQILGTLCNALAAHKTVIGFGIGVQRRATLPQSIHDAMSCCQGQVAFAVHKSQSLGATLSFQIHRSYFFFVLWHMRRIKFFNQKPRTLSIAKAHTNISSFVGVLNVILARNGLHACAIEHSP